MEARKVQRLGYHSLGISLPREWVTRAGVQRGAVVTVLPEEDGSLRVVAGSVEKKTSSNETLIDADQCRFPGLLDRLITGHYLVGRDLIRVRSREELSPDHLHEIHTAVRRLVGLTIVDQGPKHVVVQSFVQPANFPVDGLLRRLHYLTSRMQRTAFGVVLGEPGARVEDVARTEQEVDRLYWLIVRLLLLATKERSVAEQIREREPRHLVGDRVVAVALESIGDLWEEVAESAGTAGGRAMRVDRSYLQTMELLQRLLERQGEAAMKAFFARDIRGANEALELEGKIVSEVEGMEGRLPGRRERGNVASYCRSCLASQSLLRPVAQVAKHYATIALITMNRSLEAAPAV